MWLLLLCLDSNSHPSSELNFSLAWLISLDWWLKMDLILPYKVGDLTESKTFLEGYRGAWFRSKVRFRASPTSNSIFRFYNLI
jgi:hypothetical protein